MILLPQSSRAPDRLASTGFLLDVQRAKCAGILSLPRCPPGLLQSPAPQGALQTLIYLFQPQLRCGSPLVNQRSKQGRFREGEGRGVTGVEKSLRWGAESICSPASWWSPPTGPQNPPSRSPLPLSLGTSLRDMFTHVVPAVRNRPAQTRQYPHRSSSAQGVLLWLFLCLPSHRLDICTAELQAGD